jgi:hypothetical protein
VRKLGAILEVASAYPNTAVALALDVSNRAQGADAVRRAEARFGGVDVRGLGEVTARHLASEGAKLVLRAPRRVRSIQEPP